MTDEEKSSDGLSRRNLLKGAAAAIALAGTDGLASADSSASEKTGRAGRIAEENARPGSGDWQLTHTRVNPDTRYRCPWIEGYVSAASVAAGDKVDLMVSVRDDERPGETLRFKVDIYRMGYYGGTGARLVHSLGPFEGKTQPDPAVGPERLRECAWEPCASITIPDDWLSGVYLGKLSLLPGSDGLSREQSYIVFIVRDDRRADLLFQCSDNTWQAYNRWPDQYSLYDDGKTEWALKSGIRVSYDRPYGKYCQVVDAPLSQGSGEFLLWEFPLAYWLEREGYDVTYCSNTDVHANVATLKRAKALLSVGHDEYWSPEQYQNIKQAIAEGLNVAFLSGNTCCFVAPMTNGSAAAGGRKNRVLTRAGRYGGLTEIEKTKMGPFEVDGPNEALIIGARTISPYNGAGDWIVADAGHWIFEGTSMKNGDRIPGLIGWEFHGDPAKIEGLKIVAEGKAMNSGSEVAHWTSTIYPGPKNNWVFNASTIWWAQGLTQPPGHVPPYAHFGRPQGPDARVERITRNLLDRFNQT